MTKKWDEYVKNHPFGNIFQTTAMYGVYKNTKKYSPIKLCSVNEATGEIDGVLLGVTMREMTGILGKGILGEFSTRSIISGGPLVSDNSIDTLSKMIFEHDKMVQKKSLYTEIWNLHEMKSLLDNVKEYNYEDHLNFLINLEVSEEDLWRQIHKSKRKTINRAIKAGVVIEEINHRKMIPTFYDLLKETYKRVKVPLSDITLFESAFDQLVPKNMAKFFLAKYDDTYIGCRAVLTYNNWIHDWYAGALDTALSLYPNDCLVWHVLKWGTEHNYKMFDFGGAGKPDVEYGPREFKRRFGGNLVNYGRYSHIHSPIKIKITDIGFQLYQKYSL
ncbi:lipid II:glycine glycyltransferase FemX [Methanosarcina horonobensis]|uniref:lipid II:glycine glycyltransferase FemX n=1 Tax=Methanosarcina horonobensis TaxID=418008 RepID=UPI000B0B0346|nr:GNAT family N-acetyltransferase [Methanosarcina horonobensis]